MTDKVALITGITGQDGSYLAELLLAKGYIVHGIKRRASQFNTQLIDHITNNPNLTVHYGDMTDSSNLSRLVAQIQPTEVYNLAAQSHVQVSFEIPEYTADVDGVGTLRLLDAIKPLGSKCRIYQASSSELYGKVQQVPQTETTPFYPRSPYGVAKLYAYWITKNYHEAYGMYACNGILFNHTSPRRGGTFITRKVTMAVARIANGSHEVLAVGNLDARRDWGYAPEYVYAMWLMLQQDQPDDYVIATGQMHTVRELIELAFGRIGRTIMWQSTGVAEQGVDIFSGDVLVTIDPRYFRPAEVDQLLGDPSKAARQLGWTPKVTFTELINMMVDADLDKLRHVC